VSGDATHQVPADIDDRKESMESSRTHRECRPSTAADCRAQEDATGALTTDGLVWSVH